jgi:hypothetical protein
MSLLKFLFSAGTRTKAQVISQPEFDLIMNQLSKLHNKYFSALSLQVEGWCFRRVMWGPGPFVFYNDQRVAMRRVVADFARNQMKLEYHMDTGIPKEYALISHPPRYPHFASVYKRSAIAGGGPRSTPRKTKRPIKTPQHRQLFEDSVQRVNNTVWNSTITELPSGKTSTGQTPLRIVLYSRGNSESRSLKLESNLMSAIGDKFEAFTAICCDFNKVTIEQQISYAYHADVVRALIYY